MRSLGLVLPAFVLASILAQAAEVKDCTKCKCTAYPVAEECEKCCSVSLITSAQKTLQQLLETPDHGIPEYVAAKASCVAVIPASGKAAFIVGSSSGKGIVSCRTGHGWSAPAFIQLSGASFGFQIGGQSSDLVLVSMGRDGLKYFARNKLKLGGDAVVAAGPVGRNSEASTTELSSAPLLSYSRSKGLFAGNDLTGDVVSQNDADTAKFYGRKIPYESILSGQVPVPKEASRFVQTLSELFETHSDSIE